MSAELHFETIADESHVAVVQVTELFDREVFFPRPTIMMCDGYRLYVASEASGVIGAAEAAVDLFEDFAYIRKLAVSPNHRNQGIGSALLQYAMDDIREAGVLKAAICPDDDDSKRLYQRLGFAQDLTFDGSPRWLFKDLR